MRLTIIKTVITVSVAAALFPQLASATTPSFSCSSNLIVSLDKGYSASCDGDFSFMDGVLQNDTSISLTAGGFLDIGANASLIAPNISLISENIVISGSLSAPSGNIFAGSMNSIIPSSTAQIKLANQVILQTSIRDMINWGQFEIGSGASVSFNSGLNPSGTVLNSVGGSIVIRPEVTGNLIPNAGAIIITNASGIIVSSVPESSTYAMMILGLIPLSLMRKRNIN